MRLVLSGAQAVLYMFDIPAQTWRALDSSVGVDTAVGASPNVNDDFGMSMVGPRIFIYGGRRSGENSYLFVMLLRWRCCNPLKV
jgi:hypothetical protein